MQDARPLIRGKTLGQQLPHPGLGVWSPQHDIRLDCLVEHDDRALHLGQVGERVLDLGEVDLETADGNL